MTLMMTHLNIALKLILEVFDCPHYFILFNLKYGSCSLLLSNKSAKLHSDNKCIGAEVICCD